jgi:serine O-acetyltransferase
MNENNNILKYETSISADDLSFFLAKQMFNFFPNTVSVGCAEEIKRYIPEAMDRLFMSFKHINNKYYNHNGSVHFNYLNGDHYASFLYLLSNTVYRLSPDKVELATKIFLLNKYLHGVDVFYEIELPDIFLFVHPVGTVLGRAKYKNYFAVYQGCTVGGNEDMIYPTFSEGTILYEKTSVIGGCCVGENVVFGSNAFILNTNIVENSVVLGKYPDLRVIENRKNVFCRLFL